MSGDRPDFVDNRDGNTLARALGQLLGNEAGFGEASVPPDQLRIATAYFSPSGFARIADNVSAVPEVRLLLGADYAPWMPGLHKTLEESTAQFERRRMDESLRRFDEALRHERDSLPFSRASRSSLKKLIAALDAGNMQVRRYEQNFLHAKAYIFSPNGDEYGKPEGIIAGSSNLTAAGLTSNLELNLGRYDRPVVEKARQWFDELWEQAVPYDLSNLFEEIFEPRTPWEVFLRVLWQLYGDDIDQEATIDKNLPLASFQKHGAARAMRLIRERGGAIVADEVGLGKTFIAGELIQLYREHRQRALLICPAALRDSTWKSFMSDHQLFVECYSYEQLAHDKQLRDRQRPYADQEHLQRPLEEYQFVVVDEAHNYRNPDAPTRAAVLRRLLFGRRRDLLLLTATPVNNSLWDLFHLIRFFLRQDAQLADRGILSIKERFDRAMREDPTSLSPDVLYPIIDATTVKRTRQFVKKHYEGDTITDPDGNPIPIVFPQPKAMSVRYYLEEALPGFFDRLEEALEPDGTGAIAFSRYMPDAFHLGAVDPDEAARSHAMVGLLRSGLLKRFESSAYAFRKTVSKMVDEHDTFLQALDEGKVISTAFLKELSADDEAVFEDLLADSDEVEDADGYDVERLRETVQRDRELLNELAEAAATITPASDPKLHALSAELKEIVRQAADEASDGIDEIQKRKILIFSFFADTVEWVRDYLAGQIESDPELAGYRDRIVAVSGSGDLDDVSRKQAVEGFAPVSMQSTSGEDLFDLLVTTDVLAEGVNLQQCRHIINFDMPWNPMRLVQRHGRIDRIGSPHNRVFLRTIFPVDRLDEMLNLEQRILNKLAMAAASIGVAAPIEGAAHGSQVFTETRDEIEKLLREDSSLYERGGTEAAAQTGEEYRQTLRQALQVNRERITELPMKAGSGMTKGDRRGVFFCASVGDRTFLRFVPAGDGWRPDGDEAAIESELGTCLRIIECAEDTTTWYPEEVEDAVYDFWEVALRHIHEEWMAQTDPANVQPKIRPLNHRVADFIRTNPPADMSEERVNRALDILESPWPRREEGMLREWFADESSTAGAKSRNLVEQILDTGLEPVEPPPVLPPITTDDIELVCWMGIEAGE
jgi:hypothetical protein